ncbi:MAG: T9SS type A sorting domain-containing protein [Sphingobacteriales bacterium]|nr:MAG: T9SS type A sorting domain-containing protein [Sphingobacteriales bacterium]
MAVSAWLAGAQGFVTKLYDQTGNANHVQHTVPAEQPLLQLNGTNGHPTILFPFGRFLYNTNTFSNPLTIIYAARLTGGIAGRVLSSHNNNWLLGWWGGNNPSAYFEGWVQVGAAVDDQDVHVITGSMVTGEGRLYENGRFLASSGAYATPDGIRLNGSSLFNEMSDCAIYDVIAYTGTLTSSERNEAESNIWQYWVNGAQLFLTSPASGTVQATVTGSVPGCANSTQVHTVTSGVTGNPAQFGSNTWNVYAFQSGDGTLTGTDWQTNYSGHYTVGTVNMDTRNQWCGDCSPSSAPGYEGCPVSLDSHSWTAKRQGFPCAFYRIDIAAHDDASQLFVNGTKVWEHNGCCDVHSAVWYGFLSSTDQVEFRCSEGGGGSVGAITFTEVPESIAYSAATFCRSITSAPVTARIAAGGSFSATPSGLSINPSSGLIRPTLSQAGVYTVIYTIPNNPCGGSTTNTTQVTIAQSPGDPNEYGLNSWNIYAFQGGDGTAASTNWQLGYSGYYTAGTLNFDTRDYWCNDCSPSAAGNYQGCPVTIDNHSWSARRQGFPCGYYQIDIPTHDNAAQLWVNGVKVWQHEGFEDFHRAVWTGYLGSNDKIEYRVSESVGGSHGVITFTLISPNTLRYPLGCTNGGNLQPVRTGPGGGNYSSSPDGLALDPVTGVISPAASLLGTYTVTYVVDVTGCNLPAVSAEAVITNPPSVTQPLPVSSCADSLLTAPPFAGSTGASFSWTNSNPAIGLAASGTGNLPAFTALNGGTSVATATISVTPFLEHSATGSLMPGSPQMSARLFRGGLISTCANPTTYPGTFASACRYNTHSFINNSNSNICVTALLQHTGSTGNVFISAYLGSFSPANFGQNYLADGGSSLFPGESRSIGINVPAGATLVLVANTAEISSCDAYRIIVSGLPPYCQAAPSSYTISVHPAATASIAYSGSPFCANGSIALVSRSGNESGQYSAPAGLSIDPATGAINPALSQPGIYTVTYAIASAGGCASFSTTTDVEILAATSPLDAPLSSFVCNGARVPVTVFTGGGAGAAYSWINSNTSIGLAASGSGNIGEFFATNNSSDTVVAYVTVSNGAAACANAGQTFSITVLPTPDVTAEGNRVLCPNTASGTIGFSGNANTFNWSNSNTATGLAPQGSGPINFTAVNNSNDNIESIVSVTPMLTMGGTTCPGKGMSFRLTVRPSFTMAAPSGQSVCAGTAALPISFSGAPAGSTYIWRNDNPLIGLALNGAGSIPSFIAVNNTPVAQVAVITVTPWFNHCAGAAQAFAITVNGNAGAFSYSGSPYCQVGEALVTRSGRTVGTFTSTPSGLMLNNATGAINLGQSQPGTYTVTFSVDGALCNTQSTAQVIILPQATVNTVANQVHCNGATTNPVVFSGTAANFSWTNSNPSIGLAASGTGNLPSFTATNIGNTTQSALITVMPRGSSGSACNGRTITFRIQVFPTPSIDPIATQAYCRGVVTSPITFAGPVAGTIYNWTANNVLVGLPSGRGSNSIPSFTTTTGNAAALTSSITVVPSANKCAGSPMQFAYIVNPCVAQSGGVEGDAGNARMSNSLHLGPNPTRGQVTLWFNDKRGGLRTVELLDQSGRSVRRAQPFTGNKLTIDLSNLAPGTYLIRMYDPETKESIQRKVIRL